MTPYYIETNRGDAMRAQMDRYGAIVRTLAQKHGAVFVDTQAAFDTALDAPAPHDPRLGPRSSRRLPGT